MASSSTIVVLEELCTQLSKEVLKNSETTTTNSASHTTTEMTPKMTSAERCQDIITALSKQKMTLALLQSTRSGVTLSRANRALSRQRRRRQEQNEEITTSKDIWESVWKQSTALLQQWKELAADATKKEKTNTKTVQVKQAKSLSSATSTTPTSSSAAVVGVPTTVAEYRSRLVKHNKELYKDPPVLPPQLSSVVIPRVIDPIMYGEPKRDSKTGYLSFPLGSDKSLKQVLQNDFHPNRSPEEILRSGAFGGTYFRAIHSGVTNEYYNPAQVLADTVRPSWIQGLNVSKMLTSQNYQTQINKYGVKCGGSLGMWESSGWISEIDPYGWFQWYCRFYQGRRSADDARQISRWSKSAGPKGRFRAQLCNKILSAAGGVVALTGEDKTSSISPVIRQTLLHWGLEITPDVLEAHRKRVGKW